MKTWASFILLLTVTLLLPVVPKAETTHDNSTYLAQVTAGDAVIRRGADDQYQVTKALKDRELIIVHSVFTNSENEDWANVSYQNVTGWIKNSSISSEPQLPLFLFGASDFLKIYSGAATSYRISDTINSNEMVKIIDTYVNAKEIWVRAETDRTTGWVQLKELKEKPSSYDFHSAREGTQVRKGASSSYSSVYLLNLGEKARIIDFFINKEGEPWYRIHLQNGLKGWSLGEQIGSLPKAKSADASFEAKKVYINEDGAAVKSGALSTYRTVYTGEKNESLKAVDLFTNNLGEKWYRVEISPVLSGWIPVNKTADIPAVSGIFYSKAEQVQIRSGASSSYKIVGSLKKGQSIKVTDSFINSSSEVWYRVQMASGSYGWVLSSSLSEQAVYTNTLKTVGTYNADMRRGASFSYSAVARLPYSSKVTVLSEIISSNNEKWYNIELSNGKRGWIPHYELYTSLSDRKFLFVNAKSEIRRGASGSYRSSGTVQAGETLTLLNEISGWRNVETAKGIRGWIESGRTSVYLPAVLQSPKIISNSRKGTELQWGKNKAFSLSYKLLSDRSVQFNTKGIVAELPQHAITGIQSIKQAGDLLTITPQSNYSFTVRDYDDKLSITVLFKGIQGKKILIDAGHGGSDSGAIGPTKLYEKEVNLAVAKHLKKMLTDSGAYVSFTRETDIYLTLDQRVNISNSSDHDIFVSIHTNSSTSSSAYGTETYFNMSHNFSGSKSSILSSKIQSELLKQLKTRDRGSKEANFRVLKYNELPSALVELAFISNPAEESMLKKDAVRIMAAKGIYNGIYNYFEGGY